jgi:integrase
MEGVRYPQKSNREIKIFNSEKRTILEKILFTSSDSTSLGIILALFLGLRIGEICGLMWGDINYTDLTINIFRTVERIAELSPNSKSKTKVVISKPKTEKAVRTIPIPEFLREYIFKRKGDNDTFILTGTTDFIEPHCLYTRYKNFLRKNGIEDNTFHSLRHTFATRCVEEGFDTKVLAEILGHSSVTTTMNFYVHPSMENKRKQMELLAPTIH